MAPRLHAYLATVCRDMKCQAYRVGGVEDHVHILTSLARTITTAKLVEKIKVASSGWIKDLGPEHADFYWQHGYGAFSVCPVHTDDVIKYIEGQAEHHKKVSFQEEFRKFLKRYDIEYDEKYVWD